MRGGKSGLECSKRLHLFPGSFALPLIISLVFGKVRRHRLGWLDGLANELLLRCSFSLVSLGLSTLFLVPVLLVFARTGYGVRGAIG